jgi:MFS family permease
MFNTNLSSYKIPEKLEFFFVLLCLFFFIFAWSLADGFNLRLSIVFPAILIVYKIFKKELNLRIVYFSLFVVFACLLHLIISYANLSQGLMASYSLTANFKPVLSIFVISLVVSQYYDLLVKNLKKIINIFMVFFLIDLIFGILVGIENIKNDQNLKLSNLFFNCDNGVVSYTGLIVRENSHLAMISVPIILSSIVNKNFFKKNLISYIFFIFFTFNYITYSTTFHVGIVLSSILVIILLIHKKEFKFLFYFILLMGISILFLLNDKSCKLKIFQTNKVAFATVFNLKKEDKNLTTDTHINLTSDVHHYAFLVTKYSLIETNFIGLGLDNYAVGHKYFRDRFIIELTNPTAVILNDRDASSNLIKIIAEFGIFIAFPVMLFLYFVFSSKEDLYTSIFLITVIVVQLIRGAGYFNGGFALFGLMICYSVFYKLKKKSD